MSKNDINYEYDYFPNNENKKNLKEQLYHIFSDEELNVEKYFTLFENTILPLKNKFNNYQFVVTGAIGSGKSTILEILNQLFLKYNFKVHTVPEYLGIDLELGNKLLKRKIENNISNTTFQNYIMDQYKNRLESNSKYQCDVCLYERLPDDSILCFSNISNFDKVDLTNFDLFVLDKRMKALNERFNIPTYRNDRSKFEIFTLTELEPLIESIFDLIKSDIENGISHRIIGLDVSTNITLKRIKKRNREGEDGYSYDYLNRIVNYYKQLYKIMKKNRSLLQKFTCIGSLLIDE